MRENKSIVFDSIFRRTYSRLYFYALSLLSDESDADDVVEEVFAGLWRRMDEIDLEDNIEGFLYRAVYTRSINVLKRRNVDAGRLAAIEDINNMRMEYYSGINVDPLHRMENAELRRKIEDTINMLPEKCRQVFRMSYLNGMHNNDIAEELQLSVRTVEAHMYRALRFLRERLGECLTSAVIFLYFSSPVPSTTSCTSSVQSCSIT